MSLIVAILCCASISFTITTTGIFKGIREMLSRIHPKVDDLMHCPWCLGHYVVFVYLITTEFSFEFEHAGTVVAFLVTWFAVVGGMGLVHYVLLRAYEPVAKSMMKRKLDKLESDDKG